MGNDLDAVHVSEGNADATTIKKFGSNDISRNAESARKANSGVQNLQPQFIKSYKTSSKQPFAIAEVTSGVCELVVTLPNGRRIKFAGTEITE